jgi:hypothetical protein
MYNLTLPWIQEGTRVISTELWSKLEKEINQQGTKFWAAINEWLEKTNAPDYVAESIKAEFTWRLSVYPLPNGQDLSADLPKEVLDTLKARIETDVQLALEKGKKEAFERLGVKIKHLAQRLSDPNAKFHKTIIAGLEETVKTMRGLNLMADTDLEQTLDQIEDKILGFSATNLRDDKALRAQVAADANDILGVIHDS